VRGSDHELLSHNDVSVGAGLALPDNKGAASSAPTLGRGREFERMAGRNVSRVAGLSFLHVRDTFALGCRITVELLDSEPLRPNFLDRR
jgi:hypothetical protein